VDVALDDLALDPTLDPDDDDVVEKVLFLSMPRRTIAKRSSRNFRDEESVSPELSYRMSYSDTQFIT
jgi:hypothetical protein